MDAGDTAILWLMSSNKVGVVIAAYNASRWLPFTLDSVLAQSIDEWSCVVVDDGSTDGTATIADTAGRRDSRIHVHRQGNRGVSAARNAGVSMLESAYTTICFLDSDDLLLPDALQVLVQGLQDRPDAVGSSGWAEYIDERGDPIRKGEHPRIQRRRSVLADGRIIQLDPTEDVTFGCLAAYGTLWPPATVLMRRAAFDEAGGFDENLVSQEDWDLTLRMSRRGPFAVVDRQVAWYRLTDNGLSRPYIPNLMLRQVVIRNACSAPENSPAQRELIAATYRAQEREAATAAFQAARNAIAHRDFRRFVMAVALTVLVAPHLLRAAPPRPSKILTRIRAALTTRTKAP
jgi:glycosyltransferase involved in cell wall biosynthesis